MSLNARIQNLDFPAPPIVPALQRRSLIIGIIFSIATIIGFIVEPQQASHSYLLAFILCLALPLGSMALLMTWHLTGGDWGVMIRRIFEAAMATLPMLAAAFIPIVLMAYLHVNYPWSNPEELKHSEHIARQAAQYLNPNLFLFRGIMYFVAWGILAFYLLRWSDAQDRPPDRAFGARFRALSGAGIVVYGWTFTFAVIDWVMSMTPEFTSTIFGLIFMVEQALVALCLITIVGHILKQRPPMSEVLRERNFQDYGNLTLTFVMLWAYFSFSQWLIIWSGNLPEEIGWFIDRLHGDWGVVGFVLMIGHFCIPFALLLSRPLKRNSAKLFYLAIWVFLMCYLDIYWYVEPNFYKAHFHYSWLDAVAPIAMLALWSTYFLYNLKRRPLVVLHDPHLRAVLEPEHE